MMIILMGEKRERRREGEERGEERERQRQRVSVLKNEREEESMTNITDG